MEQKSGLAERVEQVRYYLGRVFSAPPQFLIQKAAIEFRKRRGKSAVLRAAANGGVYPGDFEQRRLVIERRARQWRDDMRKSVRASGALGPAVVETCCADLDAGRWPCLGFGTTSLPLGQWSRDEFHDFEWPADYFADLDFVQRGRGCDVKVPWEKSRMQWWLAAALAHHFDEDSERRDQRFTQVWARLEDWIESNPYGVGINWVSPMEVCVRGLNLALGFALYIDVLSETRRALLVRVLGAHLRYLDVFPETSQVPGHHALATQLGRLVLRELADDRRLGAETRRAFVDCAKAQFSSCGLHIEYAPTCHRLALDMVAVGFVLLSRSDPPAARELAPVLARGIEVCDGLANAGGELPVIGDNDSGQLFEFGASARRFAAYDALRHLVQCAAPERHAPAMPGEQLQGAILLGLSTQPRQKSPSGPAVCGDYLRSLPPYTICRRGGSKLVVRAGGPGQRGQASHDHDDNLSFWLSRSAQDVIVEAGCPSYLCDESVRRSAILASGHNLVTIAHRERFPGSPGPVRLGMRGGPRARAELRGMTHTPQLVCELLPSEGRPPAPELHAHRRTFTLDDTGNLRVVDTVAVEVGDDFVYRMHLPPGVEIVDMDCTEPRVRWRALDARYVVEFSGCEQLTAATDDYRIDLQYAEGHTASRVEIRGRSRGQVTAELRIEFGDT